MKYLGKPVGMWALFAGSFEKHLTVEFDLTAEQAKDVAARAKKKYREIIAKLPEFDKRDRFEMNIVNCAMLAAFILCMPQRPDIKTLTDYYAAAMMTPTMKAFCRASGKKKFTPKDIEGMKATAKLRAGDRQPLFVEHGLFRVRGRQRLRGALHDLRHLHADAGVGALRSDARAVPSRLHDERSGRRVGFCAQVHARPPAAPTATAGITKSSEKTKGCVFRCILFPLCRGLNPRCRHPRP